MNPPRTLAKIQADFYDTALQQFKGSGLTQEAYEKKAGIFPGALFRNMKISKTTTLEDIIEKAMKFGKDVVIKFEEVGNV